MASTKPSPNESGKDTKFINSSDISLWNVFFFKYILKKSQINDFQVAFAEVTSEGGCNVMGRIDLKQILRS